MKWSIASARSRFSELVRQAALEPQQIYNRDTLVATLVGANEYREYADARERKEERNLADSCQEVRRILEEEHYELHVAPRENRPNDVPDVLDETPQ
jgi:hypothetical protein